MIDGKFLKMYFLWLTFLSHLFFLSTNVEIALSELFASLWTIALQASLSRQEYWSGLPCPPQGNFPDPGIELTSLLSPVLASEFFTISAIWEALFENIGLILKSSAGSLLLSSFLHQKYVVYMKKILFSMQVFFVCYLLLISILHLNNILR